MPLDLSSVSLPEEQANQPADITQDPTTESQENANGQTQTGEVATTGSESSTDSHTENDPVDVQQGGDQVTATQAAADTQTDQAQDDKLTPFHQHPDWIKMQEDKRQLELKLARLEGQVSATQKPEAVTEKLPYASITEMAQDLMAKKKASGWQPQSAEEVAMVTQQLFEDARQAFAKQESDVKQATEAHAQKEIIDTVNELQLAGDANKEMRDKLFTIAGKIDPNMTGSQREVLMEAYRIIQMFPRHSAQVAQVTTDATNGQTTTQQATQQTTTAPTADTNKKISQGGSTGSGTTTAKKERSFASFKNETLDQVVLRLANENNLN